MTATTTLDFDVQYYSDEDEAALTASAFGADVPWVVPNGLRVDPLDLLLNSVFTDRRDYPGFESATDRDQIAVEEIPGYERYFDLSYGRLTAKLPPNDQPTHWTERIGVGVAITTLNRALGLTDADWQRRPVSQKKDLDFHLAATDDHLIILEAKGRTLSAPPDGNGRSRISGAVRGIRGKKEQQRPAPDATATFVGAVTVIPHRQGRLFTPTVYLVDPPPPDGLPEPRRYKLITRLSYYHQVLLLLGHFHILIALRNRIGVLGALQDISALDGIPLVNAQGSPFDIPSTTRTARSHEEVGPIFGRVFLFDDEPWFIGLDEIVFSILARQDFDQLRRFRSEGVGRRRSAMFLRLDDRQAWMLGRRPPGSDTPYARYGIPEGETASYALPTPPPIPPSGQGTVNARAIVNLYVSPSGVALARLMPQDIERFYK